MTSSKFSFGSVSFRVQQHGTVHVLSFESCSSSTCYQIWCCFSCEQPLQPSDTWLGCFYIPGSLFFYLYPLRWAMSPRQPSLTSHVDTGDTETHSPPNTHTHTQTHTHQELRLRWRLECFINSVSDHMNWSNAVSWFVKPQKAHWRLESPLRPCWQLHGVTGKVHLLWPRSSSCCVCKHGNVIRQETPERLWQLEQHCDSNWADLMRLWDIPLVALIKAITLNIFKRDNSSLIRI